VTRRQAAFGEKLCKRGCGTAAPYLHANRRNSRVSPRRRGPTLQKPF
jgi:hypothetical protein